MKTVQEGLVELRELLSDEKRRTRCVDARDANGRTVRSTDPTATCWCLSGGAARIAFGIGNDPRFTGPAGATHLLEGMSNRLRKTMSENTEHNYGYLHTFNDAVDHFRVLALIDQTLAAGA